MRTQSRSKAAKKAAKLRGRSWKPPSRAAYFETDESFLADQTLCRQSNATPIVPCKEDKAAQQLCLHCDICCNSSSSSMQKKQ